MITRRIHLIIILLYDVYIVHIEPYKGHRTGTQCTLANQLNLLACIQKYLQPRYMYTYIQA